MQQAVPRLDWLYALIAGATVLGATVLCVTFVLWPPDPAPKAGFRLKM